MIWVFLGDAPEEERQPTVTKPEGHLNGMTVRIQIDINPTMSILMFDANTPVDEHNTSTFATQLRTFYKHDLFDSGSRKRLRLIEQNGWQIDCAKVAEAAGRKVLTIPSPHRRDHPGLDWVMETVPLVPPVSTSAPLNPVEDGEAA